MWGENGNDLMTASSQPSPRRWEVPVFWRGRITATATVGICTPLCLGLSSAMVTLALLVQRLEFPAAAAKCGMPVFEPSGVQAEKRLPQPVSVDVSLRPSDSAIQPVIQRS